MQGLVWLKKLFVKGFEPKTSGLPKHGGTLHMYCTSHQPIRSIKTLLLTIFLSKFFFAENEKNRCVLLSIENLNERKIEQQIFTYKTVVLV